VSSRAAGASGHSQRLLAGALLLAAASVAVVTPAHAQSGVYGDVTADGAVNIIDAQQIARFSVGLSVTDPARMLTHGDVTADGAVNIIDAQQIARFSVGLSTSGRTGQPVDQPPVAAITAPADSSTFVQGASLSFEGTGSDPEDGALSGASLKWTSSLDGQIGTGGSFTTSALSVGTHTITLTATDSQGAQGADQIQVNVSGVPDLRAEIVTVIQSSLQTGGLIRIQGSITNTGSANAGVFSWSIAVDGQIVATGRPPLLAAGDTLTDVKAADLNLSPGSYTAQLVVDTQGEVAESDETNNTAIQPFTVTAGANQLPTAQITAPANGTSFARGAGVIFAGTGIDPEEGALTGAALVWTSSLDGQIGTGSSFTTSALSVGTHTITLTATDSQGAAGTTQISVAITAAPPPNQAPAAAIGTPASGSSFITGTPVIFAGTAIDPEEGALTGAALVWTSSLDGQFGTGGSRTTSALSVGTHTITLTATDSQSATGTASITVTITAAPPPNQAPSATITAPADGSSFVQDASVSFAGTGSDPEDGALSGASLVWTSSRDGQIGTGVSFTTSALSLGTHTITLTATDSQSATGTKQVSVTITAAPNQAPSASITAPANGSSFVQGPGVSFAGTGNDPEDGALTGASLVWTSSLDGHIGTGVSFTRDLSGGTHTITLTATDSQGATGTAQVSVIVHGVRIITPYTGMKFFQGDFITFTGTAADLMGTPLTGASLVWASDRDGQIGTGQSFSTNSLSVGTHKVTLVATDAQGMADTASIDVSINVPAQPGFQIDVQFAAGREGTATQRQIVRDAAMRWESLVIGDIPNDSVGLGSGICGHAPVLQLVDDLLVLVQFVPIGNGFAGSAGVCAVRSSDNLPIVGIVTIDTLAIPPGQLPDVMLHEMGHVLGIGTVWSALGFLQNPSSVSGPIIDTHMNGPQAIAAFDAAGGTAYTTGAKVPVENDNVRFGLGVLNAHWRGSVFGTELMSTNGGTALSAISVASLGDLGYVVDASGADPFTLTFPLVAGPSGPQIMFKDDIWIGPRAVVYPDGRIVPIQR